MRPIYVNMILIYVNMQDIYVDIQHNLSHMFKHNKKPTASSSPNSRFAMICWIHAVGTRLSGTKT